jgi:uncharacterized protein YbbK (DUF523 family)
MKVAISACLLGQSCRYDGSDNKNEILLEKLKDSILISFCPEDAVFGTPRPTMDLIKSSQKNKAICNATGKDLSSAITHYAKTFFDTHTDIDLYIGKDRSPSCGVCSARLFDEEKNLLTSKASGLMSQEALNRGVDSVDAESFIGFEK